MAGALEEEPAQPLWNGLLTAECGSPSAVPPATCAPEQGLASCAALCNGSLCCPAPCSGSPAAAMASGRDSDSEEPAVPQEEEEAEEGPDVKAVQAHYLRSPSPSR